MSTEVENSMPPTILTGSVYTVTWQDGIDPLVVRRFTPPRAYRPGYDSEHPPSWLMIGAVLRRYIAWIGKHGGNPTMLEFDDFTDLDSIAASLEHAIGLPGRSCFVRDDVTADVERESSSADMGGKVIIIESSSDVGVELTVEPMAIGNGWVGIVAMTKPAPRVLAIQASTAAVIAANMLGSSCRRTRTDALTFIAETAHGSFPTMLSLLSRRRKSAGCSEVEARMMRLGELLGTDHAILCSRLFELAEIDGKACIALAPELDDDDDACDSTIGTHH